MSGDRFFKNEPEDQILWAEPDVIGEFLFTFDKKRIFNLFEEYPWALTKEQREIFDRENPFWKDFFKDRG